jgi:hypothetical protein
MRAGKKLFAVCRGRARAAADVGRLFLAEPDVAQFGIEFTGELTHGFGLADSGRAPQHKTQLQERRLLINSLASSGVQETVFIIIFLLIFPTYYQLQSVASRFFSS